MVVFSQDSCRRPGPAGEPQERCVPAAGRSGAAGGCARLLLDDCEHVPGREHKELVARVLHFCAAVLAVQHDIADLDVHRDALGTSVVEPAWSDGEYLAFLWLLLG